MRSAILVALVAVLFVSACASQPPIPGPSPTEQRAAGTRFYSDLGRDEFFAAVEEVFVLADGEDFEFSYSESGNILTATREWFVFLVLAAGRGTDTWIVRGWEKDGGIEGNVSAYSNSTISDGSLYGTKERSGTLTTIAASNLFWDRVDYVLGRRADWPSCDEREEELEPLQDDGTVHGEYWFIKALCHISMKDIDPETGEATYDDTKETEDAE